MKNKINNFKIKILKRILVYQLIFQRTFHNKFFHNLPNNNLRALEEFLKTDHLIREDFIARYSLPLFDGLHPKNVFNYRYIFFKENLKPNDVVIDVACGTGLILSKIADNIKEGYGLDYDDYNLNQARQKHSKSNLTFVKSDLYEQDYEKLKKELKFNTAIFSHILEHVENPVDLIKKVNADKILVCVPSQDNWITQLRMKLGLPFKKDPTHFREYTKAMITNELVSAGYMVSFVGYNSEGEIIARGDKKTDSHKPIKVNYAGVSYTNNFGGKVKLQHLQNYFPEYLYDYDLMYFLSASLPENYLNWIDLTKKQNKKIVLNQNGVMYKAYEYAYPAVKSDEINSTMAHVLKNADFVVYQSKFAKLCADKFLVERTQDFEVIHNCVDTTVFKPIIKEKDFNKKSVNLMIAGNFNTESKLKIALEALVYLKGQVSDKSFKLLLAGRFNWSSTAESEAKKMIEAFNLKEEVEFLGEYSQSQAPSVLNKGDIYIHTQYNDVCPTLVIEAMSCGLPIIYSDSGGTPELVGNSGIGIKTGLDWEKELLLEPTKIAQAILKITSDLENYSSLARQRAVNNFDVKSYISKHRVIFENLINK